MLALEPANPAVASRWMRLALGAGLTSGALSFASLLRENVPAWLLERYPEYQTFVYAAVVISLSGGMLLIFVKKVITVSYAQLAAMIGWIYCIYAVVGVFTDGLTPVFVVLVLLATLVLGLIFGQSIGFIRRNGTWGDLILTGIFFCAAAFMALYPLYVILRPAAA